MIVVFFPILKGAKKQAPREDQRPVWSVFFLIVQGLNVKSAYMYVVREFRIDSFDKVASEDEGTAPAAGRTKYACTA